jgi:hypothetical protein
VSRTTVKGSFPPDVVATLPQSRDEKQAAAFWKIEPLKIVGKTIRLFAARFDPKDYSHQLTPNFRCEFSLELQPGGARISVLSPIVRVASAARVGCLLPKSTSHETAIFLPPFMERHSANFGTPRGVFLSERIHHEKSKEKNIGGAPPTNKKTRSSAGKLPSAQTASRLRAG